jgi:hypothetical protein
MNSIIKPLFSWILAGLLGILFYICYGFSRKLLWSWNVSHLLTWINPRTDFQNFIFILSLNSIVALTSSLPGSVLCGFLLIKLFRKKAILYGLGSICICILLFISFRLHRGVEALDLSAKISALITPIIVNVIFFMSILIIRKYLRREGIQ